MRFLSTLFAVALTLTTSEPAGAAPSPKPLVVIPYRSADKLVLVPVAVGRSPPVWFIFDSGASHSVLDPTLALRLGLKSIGAGATTGAGAGAVPVVHVAPLALHLGTANVPVHQPWVIDLSKAPIPRDVKGLIGYELLQQYVVRLDPTRRTLTLFDASTYQGQTDAASLPLVTVDGKLFIDATIDVKPRLSVTHRMRIDTGSGDSISDPVVAGAVQTRKTIIGQGLGANFEAVSGLVDAVHVGPFTVRDVWAPGGPKPSIGMEMLRRFIVTFDVRHDRIELQPTPSLAEAVPAPS